MPNAEFLEEYPLYRKFDYNLPFIKKFPKVSINMRCHKCDDKRTFVPYHIIYMDRNQILDIDKYNVVNENPIEGSHFILRYICASCGLFERIFVLKVGKNIKQIFKTGQYPPWDINIKKKLRKILGEYSDYYKKGLICESRSQGIGANIYYRRIVEGIIGELLEDLKEFLAGEEREKYEEVLDETKRRNTAQDKIRLVKNLIPPILMTGSLNPLTVLYDILSGDIHGKTDEECLAEAGLIRTSLIFLVNSILNRRKDQQEYTESIKILEKKRKTILKRQKKTTEKEDPKTSSK